MSEPSLFERLGGDAAVDAAVDIFHGKVQADARINCTGRGMRAGHARLNLTEEHFHAVMENLGSTLKELNVPDPMIGEAAAIALSVKDDVLNR